MNEAVLVCSLKGYFDDDVKAECADCGRSIVHRPNHPGPKDVRKICLLCARTMFADADSRDINIPPPEPQQEEELMNAGFTPEQAHAILLEFAADPLSQRWRLK